MAQPRFRLIYVETPTTAELIERYQAAHQQAAELCSVQRTLRNASLRQRCRTVVCQSELVKLRNRFVVQRAFAAEVLQTAQSISRSAAESFATAYLS